MLNIDMEFKCGVLFVRLKGSLNRNTSKKLLDNLLPIITNQGIKNLVYNFSDLVSIDDVGNKSLLMGYDAILNNHGNVLVVNNRFNLKYFKETQNELKALEILKV